MEHFVKKHEVIFEKLQFLSSYVCADTPCVSCQALFVHVAVYQNVQY